MTSWPDSRGRCGKPGRFLAPIHISRAAGDLAVLLALPGLLRVARLSVRFSHGDSNTISLFLGAEAKGRAGCCAAPALRALTAVVPGDPTVLFHLPSQGRNIGAQPRETQGHLSSLNWWFPRRGMWKP